MVKTREAIEDIRVQNIIDREIALSNSAWAVANGYRLLSSDRWPTPEGPNAKPKPEEKRSFIPMQSGEP